MVSQRPGRGTPYEADGATTVPTTIVSNADPHTCEVTVSRAMAEGHASAHDVDLNVIGPGHVSVGDLCR